MMVALLLDAYCVGVFSSRKIMARCETDVAFRTIVGEDVPEVSAAIKKRATLATVLGQLEGSGV